MNNIDAENFGVSLDSTRTPRFFTETGMRSARSAILGQLTDLIYVDAPLTEGLVRAAMDSPSQRIQSILLSIRLWLLAGYPLSTALSKQGSLFPSYCIEIVRAGEESGRLYDGLRDLEEIMENDSSIRAEFIVYNFYLFLVVAAQWVLISGLIIFVVPSFAKIFSDMNAALPASTELLITLSTNFFVQMLVPFAFPISILCLFFGADRVLRWFRLERFVKKLPGLSRLAKDRDLAHVTTILGRLLHAGYPPSEALRFFSTFKINRHLSNALSRAQRLVESGVPLGQAMKEQGNRFPDNLTSVITLAEFSGNYGELFTSLGNRYRRSVLKRGRLLLYLSMTFAIIVTGIMTGMAYIALFMPIMSFSSIVGG